MDVVTDVGNGWEEELNASEELVEEFAVDKSLDIEHRDWPTWFLIDDTFVEIAAYS